MVMSLGMDTNQVEIPSSQKMKQVNRYEEKDATLPHHAQESSLNTGSICQNSKGEDTNENFTRMFPPSYRSGDPMDPP